MEEIEYTLNKLEQDFKPVSIFIYGSHARTDARPTSDYEIGLLFPEKQYVLSATVRQAVGDKRVSPFPFKLEAFQSGNPDTPFEKRIYMRDLALTGRTLRGEKIVEHIRPPAIRSIDIFADAKFSLGRALASTIAHKDNASKTARELFYKSALFAARDLAILKTRTFPLTYEQMFVAAKPHVSFFEECEKVLAHAIELRTSDLAYDPYLLYRNITFINQIVVPELQKYIEDEGPETILIS
jgi:hypothetical protein